MLDITNTQSNAFREPPGSDTAQLQPMHSFPPLAGGIAYARVGARFPIGPRQALTVRDLDLVMRDQPNLKLVARCLGKRRGPHLETCDCVKEAANVTELKAGHPNLYDLKERHEVHVFAYYSEDALHDPGYEKRKEEYDKRISELASLEGKGRYAEAQSLRQMLGWDQLRGGKPEPPRQEIVGLCVPTAMSGGWDHVHPERTGR